ncbi:MAG: aminopeptidase [Desulfurococcales archaeon]|nr:aminopeptidase [Desulfurococcales archaeon]
MYSQASGIASSMVSCLGLGKGDRILIIYDTPSRGLYKLLSSAAEIIMVEPVGVDIDALERPLHKLPGELADYIREEPPDASFYVAGVKPGELPFRSELIRLLTSLKARHVHMPKATMEILAKAAGCMEAARATMRLYEALRGVEELEATAPGGTRLRVRVSRYRWVADTGIIGPGEWGNWPPGEVYTTPTSVDGVLVVDGVIGDYFTNKYGLLNGPAVRLEIREGKIVGAEGPLAGELIDYLSRDECGLRIGEVGVGSNPGIDRLLGNMLHDEKMPGIHIAAGDPLGERTGATWRCGVHVDMLPLHATVRAGGRVLVGDGRLLV